MRRSRSRSTRSRDRDLSDRRIAIGGAMRRSRSRSTRSRDRDLSDRRMALPIAIDALRLAARCVDHDRRIAIARRSKRRSRSELWVAGSIGALALDLARWLRSRLKSFLLYLWTTPYLLKFALIVGMAGLTCGYDSGVLPQVFLLVEDESKLIKLKETEFQNTLLSVGLGSAILGSSGGPWVAETLGRKISIICADILFVIGLAMFSMAPATEMLVLGRVCVGIGMGLLTVMTPQLLGEISTAPIRGSLTSLNGLFFGLGYLSSSIFSVLLLKFPNAWRYTVGVGLVFPFMQIFFILKIGVESPIWLLQQGRTLEAEELTDKLHPREIADELKKYFKRITESGVCTFPRKAKLAMSQEPFLRALRAGLTVQAAQNFSGFKMMLKYLPDVLHLSGMRSSVILSQVSIISSSVICFGFLCTFMVIDRIGRRVLFICSLILISLVHLGMGSIINTSSKNDQMEENGFLGFAGALLYTVFFFSYTIGIGTLTPIYNAEIYETKFSLVGMGTSFIFSWTLALIMGNIFVPPDSFSKASGTFYLSCGLSLLGLIAVYTLVPETLQKTPEQILEIMKEKFYPWPFNSR
uniref:Major facilitator superfamily (MFS) profile domain-containing protein n=1 Tax=Quercus lobata TaxID=97700 RepID=A0A7N2MDT7_QUELO